MMVLNNQADLFYDVGPSTFAQDLKFVRDGDFVYRHMTIGETTYSEFVSSYYKSASERDDFFLSYLNASLASKTAPRKKLNYIDLFCGGGGLSLGVQNAGRFLGYNPKLNLAADIDKHALNLTSAHFKPVFARNKSVEELIEYEVDLSGENSNFISAPFVTDHQIKELKGRVDLLVGGPPCQGHSNLNNKTRRFDPRNLLYFVMPAFAVALNIPNIIIENVRLINKASENVVEITKSILKHNGYSVSEFILTASDFGVAQSRTRHFLIASKERSTDQFSIINSFKGSPISFNSACLRKV
jgi:DNA (cytosine-5)-methyltransferase 1